MPDILHNLTIQSSAENVYDALDLDNNKNRLCYLYLKNKTFINAHLIKIRLAKTDNSLDSKHYKRFLKYDESAV